MRIFTNFVQLADSPNERILVIYGAGHLGWLRFAVASDPTLGLRRLAEFARQSRAIPPDALAARHCRSRA